MGDAEARRFGEGADREGLVDGDVGGGLGSNLGKEIGCGENVDDVPVDEHVGLCCESP